MEGMIKELWHSFPRLLEQKINALLDEAEPAPAKAFQLYKRCQQENLWSGSFDNFSLHLNGYFSLPKAERRKSHLDTFLVRPLAISLYEEFQLTFRNAVVNNRSLLNIASWAHHLIRVSCKTECPAISEDVLAKTLNYLTHPPLFEKDKDILFDDFCQAWKKIVFKLFGKKYDLELNEILRELRRLEAQLAQRGDAELPASFIPGIYLTQTEIDWVSAIHEAVIENSKIPRFPLSRGPQKPRLIDLERVIQLYRIVQTTRLPELIKHRNRIRTTILYQCESLLRERAR